MSFNHRVMRREYVHADGEVETTYHVHEVYYDADDTPNGCTENAVSPMGETPEVLRKELAMFAAALDRPILDYDTLREI